MNRNKGLYIFLILWFIIGAYICHKFICGAHGADISEATPATTEKIQEVSDVAKSTSEATIAAPIEKISEEISEQANNVTEVVNNVADQASTAVEETVESIAEQLPSLRQRNVSSARQMKVVVKEGDCLSTLSEVHFGTFKKFMKIYDDNRGVLSDPNKIYPGQELILYFN